MHWPDAVALAHSNAVLESAVLSNDVNWREMGGKEVHLRNSRCEGIILGRRLNDILQGSGLNWLVKETVIDATTPSNNWLSHLSRPFTGTIVKQNSFQRLLETTRLKILEARLLKRFL